MKYRASEPLDELQIKVKVIICIFIIDLLKETYIICYISAKWLCETYNCTLSSLVLTLILKMMSWLFYHIQCCNSS